MGVRGAVAFWSGAVVIGLTASALTTGHPETAHRAIATAHVSRAIVPVGGARLAGAAGGTPSAVGARSDASSSASSSAPTTADRSAFPDVGLAHGGLPALAPLGALPLGAATPRQPTPGAGQPSAAGAPRQFTVIAAGDILLHTRLWAQGRADAEAAGRAGYFFDPIFASARPDIAGADLAICHMETPYGKPNGPFTSFPVFEVPPAIAQTIHDVGYDSCSTASNHSLDGGEAGIDRTLDALDAAGVKHSGTARSAAEAAQPDLLQANGVTVAQLSYAYGFNGIKRPADKPWLANLISVPQILADAKRAKQAGASVVIVSLHFGTEYQHTPNAQQLSVARALLASPDVDLIIGCHAHVVQPFQKINGKWVVYGMGNQIATQGFSQPTMDGVMPRFTFTETSPGKFTVTKAEAIPTYDSLGGQIQLIDLPLAMAAHPSAARMAVYEASWKRTAEVVDSMGAAKDGLIVDRGTAR
ncbi:MAG TPA: CapA family protein [Micromonosporaceae bacterium]|nr:CapA family protein [Micromonosporaceae bacterium]